MRPLATLGEATRGLRGIFCDIDDTLTHEGVLVPEAYQALARAHAAGLRLVPVTGRPAGWAAVLAATWPVDAVIAENGALYFRRDGRVATVRYWQSEAEREAAQPVLRAVTEDVLAHVPRARLANDQWLRRCDLAFDIHETRSLAEEEIAAIAARVEAGGLRVTRSSIHLHALAGDWDKAKMCVRLARELFGENLDADPAMKSSWLFVGDSMNDQSCFSYFPLSAGVANVSRWPELRPAYVAAREGGFGFAEIVAAVLDPLR